MDQVDLAELLVTEHLEAAIAAARGIRIQTKTNTRSLKKCTECNDLIPVKRRRAIKGCIRCVECEEDHEKYKRVNKRIRVEHDSLDDMIEDIHLSSL